MATSSGNVPPHGVALLCAMIADMATMLPTYDIVVDSATVSTVHGVKVLESHGPERGGASA